MSSATSSSVSLSEFFRPITPKGLRSRDLSHTRLNLLKKEIQTDLHLIPLQELYERLRTDPVNGLTKEMAQALLAFHGPNTLTPATEQGWFKKLIKSLCTGISINPN
ncbi:hypothetical protein HF086_014547 [Spodoptera exigua]|uniref:Cation-transporting P-type ATPase N-terminal domain-containing protein n=1 Tax=Spodoptera exigua TaxID=7107 RepID=A0A922SCM3_SPOEX|nr:hypothetical protein HF086_014547 [Spodoptera exigua]